MHLTDFAKGKSPIEMFYHWEKHTPDAIYLRQSLGGKWREYSWRETGDQIRRLANALRSLGLQQGDRVAVLSKNCAEWMITDLALQFAGLISVPLYVDQTADSLHYVLEHSGAKAIFVGKLDTPVWQRLKPSIPEGIVTIGFSFHGADCDFTREGEVDCLLPDLLKQHEPLSGQPVPHDEDIWTIIYTSGTTGHPKGVVHCYRAPRHVGHHALAVFSLCPEDRALSFLPLAHVAERLLVANNSLYAGMQINFTHSLQTFQADLCAVRPTIFFSVPRLWKKFQDNILERLPQSRLDRLLAIPILGKLIAHRVRKALGLDRARIIVSGAAALSPSLLDWYGRVGIRIVEGYGLTENFAYGFIGRPNEYRLGTVGRAMPDNGAKLSTDGEILFKGPALMLCYYKDPAKTNEALDEDGFFHTGDIGQLDQDGFLRITGRIKEIFKTEKGEYVSPAPIENKIASFTQFEHICLIGSGLKQPILIATLKETITSSNRTATEKSINDSIKKLNAELPNHEKISGAIISNRDWSSASGLLTPTLKIRRNQVESVYSELALSVSLSGESIYWEENHNYSKKIREPSPSAPQGKIIQPISE